MNIRTKLSALVAAVSFCAIQHASAVVIATDLGTGAPPATLGGYTMGAFDPGSIAGSDYTSYESGGLGYGGWATWGQSYTGAVYVTLTQPTLTLTLGAGTHAVYFYEEPNQFSDFTMTATYSGGAPSVTTVINGFHGSSGVGFYTTGAGETLTSIVVTCSDPSGFAIGEFGVDTGGSLTGTVGVVAETVPDTGVTFVFMALGLAGLAAYKRSNRVAAVKA